MKRTALIISLAFVVSLTAQSQQPNRSEYQSKGNPKEDFIRNQAYLTGRPLAAYGDSLSGYDETAVNSLLAERGVHGTERLIHLNAARRDFIDGKYGLGNYAARPAAPVMPSPPPAGGKVIGGGNFINVAPCVNEGFESTSPGSYAGLTNSTAIAGWTISSLYNNGTCGLNTYTAGSSRVWVRTTPITGIPALGNLGASPLGGSNVLQILDNTTTHPNGGYYMKTKIAQTFPVTQANTLFQFAYAGSWNDGGHLCCEQPALQIRLLSCSLTPLACSSLSLNASGSQCPSGASGYSVTGNISWTNWVVKYIDLTPFIGSCVTIEVINQDCIWGGHWGMVFFDASCGGQLVGGPIPGNPGGIIGGPVSFCSGSNQAMISAPLGYASYQWIAPGPTTVAAPQGTMSTLVITNPQVGAVYTVNLVSGSGCQYISTHTLSFTQVNIVGIGSSPSCPNGSSGTATVVGNGSGTGYNYTWVNSTNSVVGTQSVAMNLPPGTYSVTITGLGSSGCGSATASTTITAVPPTTNALLKPYCGSVAYLQTGGGTNYKWYQGNTLITGTAATLPFYNVSPATNGAVYWVSYTTLQGCKDSTRFTLVQSPPGNIFVPAAMVKTICPGSSNGSAIIYMNPAPASPPGFNSFYVASTGTTPAYTSSLYPTNITNYTVSNLAPGTYTVLASDGSCNYSTSFIVPALVFNYTVTPPTATLCPGNFINASITLTSQAASSQFTYSWSPTAWIPGGNGNFQNIIVQPSGIPQGSNVTTIFTIVVTPTLAPCAVTKTIAITAVNPPIPTITPVPPLCNTSPAYQILATPGGGTFINSPTTPTLIGTGSGQFLPSVAPIGPGNFTYAINVNTCIAKQTGTFQVSQFYSAALTTPTLAPLCVTNPPVNLMAIVQNTTNGSWIPGPGVTGSSFNPAGLQSGNYVLTYSTFSSPDPSACSHSNNISVAVTNTMIPEIMPLDPICNTKPAFTMTVSPAGGMWSGPNISPAGVITPSNISQPGTSTVFYSVSTGPCVNTATTSFSVSRFNTAALNLSSLGELCFNNPPVNLMTLVQSTVNGTWSGPGVGIPPNVFNPSGLMTGSFTLDYYTTSTPPLAGCSHSSALGVQVLKPETPVITQAGPFCTADGPVQLNATPANGHWISVSYLSPTGIFSPSLAAVGNNAVQYVVGTPTCYAKDTRNISVEAFVPSQLISESLPGLCNTSPAINLAPFAVSSNGSWTGPGVSGTSFNPGLAGAGTHVVIHKTSSSPSGLCPSQSTVAVIVYSLQSPVIGTVPRVCNTALPIQLAPTPLGGLFGGLNTGAVDQKGLFMPASAVIGENVITYSITSGPCVAYAQTTITVDRFVSAELVSIPDEFCTNSEPVNMNGYVLNPGGTWSGAGMAGNMFNPKNALPGRNKITYQTFSIPTPTLCPDTRTIELVVTPLPPIVAVANTDKGCAPLEVLFNIQSVNFGEGAWYLGDGEEPRKGLFVSHVYTSPGTYSVTFNYSFKSCRTQAEVKVPITVYPMPEANFAYPDEILISSPQVQLTNLTPALGDHKYIWQVQGQKDIEGEVHPVVEFPEIGKYQVTLIAQSHYGCRNEVTKTLEVMNDFNLFIPTAFTPNYDGTNDYFRPEFTPYGLDMRSFEMEIFDRWGHVVYHTRDITKGWDGSLNNKGEPLKEEVYIYRIRYKDMEGNAYTRLGHVTLTR